MTVRVTGLRQKQATLKLFRQKLREEVKDATIDAADIIKEESEALAPVLTGALEASHEIEIKEDSPDDFVATVSFHAVNEKDGYDYGVAMHESYYNLGQKSQEKAESTGKAVGRKFLTRAIVEKKQECIELVKEATRQAIRKSGANK